MSTPIERTPPVGWRCPVCGATLLTTETPGTYTCTRKRCSAGRTLYATDHSVDQYRARGQVYEYGPTKAFERGFQLDERHDLKGDEFRYDHNSRTVTIRKDTGIVTVISVHMSRPCVLEAAIRTCVTEMNNPQAAGELCAEKNIDVEQFREITSDLRARSGKPSGRSASSATQKAYSEQRTDSENA